jgi:repressor LexA
MELPLRQNEALQIVRKFIKANGFPPTVKDIAVAMGISIHAADCHLRALDKKNVIQRTPGIARGITIVAGSK